MITNFLTIFEYFFTGFVLLIVILVVVFLVSRAIFSAYFSAKRFYSEDSLRRWLHDHKSNEGDSGREKDC